MKVLNNVKYQYFSLVNVVKMANIDANNIDCCIYVIKYQSDIETIKLLYLSLCLINNQSVNETN